MHQDAGLLEMDPLYRLFLVILFVILLRSGAKSFGKRAIGESDYEGLISLLAITLTIGLSAIFRIALVLYDKSEAIRVFGISSSYYWTLFDEIKLNSFIYGISASLFGCLIIWVVLKAASIKDSVWSKRLVRFRYWLFGSLVIGVSCWLVFAFWYIPHRNRLSILSIIESSVAIDAYREPQEVIVYKVTPESRMPPYPPNPDGADIQFEKVNYSEHFNQHEFNGSAVANPKTVRKCLDQINVYKANRYGGFVRSDYLIRYINKKSVVDVWISEYFDEIEFFVSKDASKLESVLEFSEHYKDLMVEINDWGLRFSTSDRDWNDDIRNLFL